MTLEELKLSLPSDNNITIGTMMKAPCIRVNKNFLTMIDTKSGDLFLKLPEDRVNELIEQNIGEPFNFTKKQFKEWVIIPSVKSEKWIELCAEGYNFLNS